MDFMELKVNKKYVLSNERKEILRFLDLFLTQDEINELNAKTVKDLVGENGSISRMSYYDTFTFQAMFLKNAQEVIQKLLDEGGVTGAFIEQELNDNKFVIDTCMWRIMETQKDSEYEIKTGKLPF